MLLLQPETIYKERINVAQFAEFIRSVESNIKNQWSSLPLSKSCGFVVMAVRDTGEVNAWIDIEPLLPAELEKQMLEKIRSMPGAEVRNGTIVFALNLSINGAITDKQKMPYPAQWQEITKSSSQPMDVEMLVNKLWP